MKIDFPLPKQHHAKHHERRKRKTMRKQNVGIAHHGQACFGEQKAESPNDIAECGAKRRHGNLVLHHRNLRT